MDGRIYPAREPIAGGEAVYAQRGEAVHTQRENRSQEGRQYIPTFGGQTQRHYQQFALAQAQPFIALVERLV
eukprot:8081638-Pyramimonas_sp.AAC.1